jgi:hypothetical protein
MNLHLIAYYIGIFIVFASHLFLLYNPDQKNFDMKQHSYANLFAAVLIAYYFMNKEGFINF